MYTHGFKLMALNYFPCELKEMSVPQLIWTNKSRVLKRRVSFHPTVIICVYRLTPRLKGREKDRAISQILSRLLAGYSKAAITLHPFGENNCLNGGLHM